MDTTTRTIIEFIRSIGLKIEEASITGETVLPGIDIANGGLIYDPERMLYPGDLLHEAGHLAVVPKAVRDSFDGPLDPKLDLEQSGELMAIPWSYAACLHLKIDPAIVFHPHGYHGGSQSLLDNFSEGRYIGVPMLEWTGLCFTKQEAAELGEQPFPVMKRWIRE